MKIAVVGAGLGGCITAMYYGLYNTVDSDVEVTIYHDPNVPIERVCLLYTSPSPRDGLLSRMPSSA